MNLTVEKTLQEFIYEVNLNLVMERFVIMGKKEI